MSSTNTNNEVIPNENLDKVIDYKKEVSDFGAYKDSMLKKESKEISKLRKEVKRKRLKNYCTVFYTIYNKFGIRGLKEFLST